MAERKRHRKSSFAAGMLLYALIFAALVLSLLRPLWNYLAAYEESGPNKAMDRYLATFDAAHVHRVSDSFLQGLELGLQSEEQAFAEIEKLMNSSLRYSLKSSDGDLMHASYAIRSGDQLLGSVSIGKEEDPPFGFSPWEVESEDFDFSWMYGEDEITVPGNWTVSCNGVALDESYRTGEAVPYELLAEFYGDSRFVLPAYATYRVDHIVGKAPFSVTDEEGRPVDPAAELSEYELLANCDENESEQIRALLDSFLQRYINCLSNVSRNALGNYQALQPYILSGSDIDVRVRDNMEGQAWAHSLGDTVEERTDKLLVNLGNGYYLADISYKLDTVGNKGHVESINNAKILMARTNAGLRVVEIYSY